MDNPDQEPVAENSGNIDSRSIEERLEAALTPKQESPEDDEPEGQPESEVEDVDGESVEAETLEEIEFEGKRAKVPKELKEAFLRQADYTRKTQEVADERRQVAEERKLFDLNRQLEAVISDDIAEFRSLQTTSRQLEAAMNSAYQNQDPASLATYNAQYTLLQNQLAQKSHEIQSKKNQQASVFAYEKQQRLASGFEKVKSLIPNFGAETQADLKSTAKKLGYEEYELDGLDDPRALLTLWQASQWQKLQSAKPGITKRAAEAPKTLRAAGQKSQSVQQQKADDLKARAKRTGRLEDVAALLERRLTAKR